jgi:hypothetical protein
LIDINRVAVRVLIRIMAALLATPLKPAHFCEFMYLLAENDCFSVEPSFSLVLKVGL